LQAYLALRTAILDRGAAGASEVVATPQERAAACAALSSVARHMRALRAAPADRCGMRPPWLPQYAMLSRFAEQLLAWLLAGPPGRISILAEPGMQVVVDTLPPEMLAAHRAVQHGC
jgi:hypothetical protein